MHLPVFFKTDCNPTWQFIRTSVLSQAIMGLHHQPDNVREPAVAGSFYPSTSKELKSEVEEYFRKSAPERRPDMVPRALIVPHAGYLFSGEVAAAAFHHIPEGGHFERVFVIASSHRESYAGASVWCSGNYRTPLGEVPVDTDACRTLVRENRILTDSEDAHIQEHSLEVQLPFLQLRLGKGWKLVPILMGTRRAGECREVAEALRPWFVPGNLFIFSSDFSHYPSYADAVETDKETTRAILSNSPAALLKTLEQHKVEKVPGLLTSLCGWTSVLTLMYLTEGGPFKYEWITYRNSGDQPMYGDRTRVVGYSAIAVFEETCASFSLTEEEKESLLKIASRSVASMVRSDCAGTVTEQERSGQLAEPGGAFVSLYVKNHLRGCIGSFEGGECLADVVNRVAASSVHDKRFTPVSQDELSDLSIEISVLTPLKRIQSPEEIILGKHGIHIRQGWSAGTFLPQVAQKYGWSLEEFLGRCSRDKAGLGWNGWKEAELYTFEAIIFGKAKE